jgi:hypothetical protein
VRLQQEGGLTIHDRLPLQLTQVSLWPVQGGDNATSLQPPLLAFTNACTGGGRRD